MNQNYINQAAGAFMTLDISISRWSGVAQLKSAATKAADDAGADSGSTRLYFNILGKHHADLKQVNSLYAAIRTYLYENTLPFSQDEGQKQKRGKRLVPVSRVPEVLTKLQALKEAADNALNAFIADYDRLVQASMANDVGQFGREISFPSAQEVRNSFGARISPPEPLNVADMERFGSLPAGMAKEIAEANNKKMAKQLEAAKEAAIHEAQEQMDLVAKQLEDGSRLHDSLITNSKRVARMLRDMVQGYDNDPRLIELADLIDEKIGTVPTAKRWNDSPQTRDKSLRAAQTVSKGIKELRKAAKPAPTANQSGTPTGGLIADLLD